MELCDEFCTSQNKRSMDFSEDWPVKGQKSDGLEHSEGRLGELKRLEMRRWDLLNVCKYLKCECKARLLEEVLSDRMRGNWPKWEFPLKLRNWFHSED